MDIEETKKIIESKIEAEAVTKNVRSKIKSYIHEKQNLREGFRETFTVRLLQPRPPKDLISTFLQTDQ